jgi:hypothetical protein
LFEPVVHHHTLTCLHSGIQGTKCERNFQIHVRKIMYCIVEA